ncbi:MAG: 30S ribosome-binding factor RbfA [Phycisphaerales bacterium]|nr:30S ribosome-binding factor RbfA [Phycisphaerales bacterium]
MTHRSEQRSSVLRRGIQRVIDAGLSDPRIKGSITVTRVSVDTELTFAKVYVAISPESSESVTMHGIKAAAKHIRHRLSEVVEFRRLPVLDFRLDVSLRKEQEVLRAIATVMAELEPDEDEDEGGNGNGTERDDAGS